MSTTKEDFTIGADPEFCCFKSGGDVVPADNYSERNCFGADGGGTAFEVRPDFSTNPLRVVSNIHKSLLQLVMKTPEFMDMEWQAGSWCETPGQPLGGHIHFGGLPRSPGVETCCNWLDQYVGSLSLLIENYEEGKHRRDDGYGLKSDYRTNDHGFEYRTCSSWLTSPYIAAAILCLAKATVHECANRKGKSAPRHVTHEHFKTMDVKTIKAKFGDIWSYILSTSHRLILSQC